MGKAGADQGDFKVRLCHGSFPPRRLDRMHQAPRAHQWGGPSRQADGVPNKLPRCIQDDKNLGHEPSL